ncbi:unnamed protein product, partial [Symbiodinium sp. CCMP2456]
MAGAGYDGVNGRATVGRPTSSGAGVKEDPTFADELYSAGCDRVFVPTRWEDDLKPLMSALDVQPTLHRPTLKGLASNTAPTDDDSTLTVQREILQIWREKAQAPPPPPTSPLVHVTHLRGILPSALDCMTLLSLPMSLKTGSLRVNVDQFGSDIGDFADRAMRLRCCTEQEAWRICVSPLIAISAALAELCETLQQLPEDKAFDLSWPELARPQVWWWLLVDEIVAQLQHAAEASQAAPLARDASFFVIALGGPERHASPLQYCGALMPMQVLIYVLRRLVDNPVLIYVLRRLVDKPAAYPHLQILGVFKDTDCRGKSALYNGQWDDGSASLSKRGWSRSIIPLSIPPILRLLAAALARVRQWSQLEGYDVRGAISVYP